MNDNETARRDGQVGLFGAEKLSAERALHLLGLRIDSYRVREWAEQGECPQCGEPLLTGDAAYQLTDKGNEAAASNAEAAVEAGFCCRGCARRYAQGIAERAREDEAAELKGGGS